MIYVVHPDVVNFKTYVLDSKDVRRKLGSDTQFHFDQRPISYAGNWQPLHIEFAKVSGGKKGGLPDIMVRHGRLFLNSRAYDALHDLLQSLGEFLPVSYAGGTGYLFNVLALAEQVDGVDPKLSTKNEYGELQSLSFHEDRLKDLPLFRTAFDNYLGVYCQDAFKAACEAAELKGVVFSPDLGNIFPPDSSAGRPAAH